MLQVFENFHELREYFQMDYRGVYIGEKSEMLTQEIRHDWDQTQTHNVSLTYILL